MSESTWEKTKRFSKKGFDKTWAQVDKLGAPVNRLSNKLGAEAFWPMTLDKESDKAARILRSFCKDGFYAPETEEGVDENGKINRPKGKQRVIKKIPAQVLKNAKGIAIFTTMRTGLWISGSGGSGVLLGRVPETGEWSPPSGIMLHTAGIGFLAGVDIYDCVVIINTLEALEAFKKLRCTLGGEVSVAAGPVGMGGVLDSEVHKRQAPIWTYMKSKGLYAGVAVDGTIIIERSDENERFYGERISVTDILNGKARHPRNLSAHFCKPSKQPKETGMQTRPYQEDHGFGVPAAEDPDPYGVKALEAEGMFIREAGTKSLSSGQTLVARYIPHSSRRSFESSPRNSWRASVQSYTSVNRGTQTDDPPLTAATSVSRASSRSAKESPDVPSSNPWNESQWDTVPVNGVEEKEEDKDLEDAKRVIERAEIQNENDENHPIDYEDFEVHEVSNAKMAKQERAVESPVEERPTTADSSSRSSPTFTRARLVTINKRPTPPSLPPRHPNHTWGSGSSRESTSPTALSHSSRSTEPTEAAGDSVDLTEGTSEAAALPSNIKKFQANTVLPAVVDEDDFDEEDLVESETEIRTEKDDEFHSVNSDAEENSEEKSEEDNTFQDLNLTGDVHAMDIENLEKQDLEPISPKSIDEPQAEAEPEAEAETEPKLTSDTEKLHIEDLEAAAEKPIEPKSEEFDNNRTMTEDQSHDIVNLHALNAQAA
ncbi:uncharacterized protein N7483_002617 [Penicillium malachiteum]|uniref:uncharacterized protein n=1 Tax=Penicillium malachiteum TaxID=1324776 RepID=UPI002549BBC2|nr:uncharacterized protein N7483_002617 [Penicillium malachiteum]KAJ5737492.1 hypothetical protein N7483_002617 [Penicillium malachiteum]